MNLITRIILLFAAVSLLVFLAGGVISYRVMKREVDAEQRRYLHETLDRWTHIIRRIQPEDTLRRGQVLVIPLNETQEETIAFSDTLAMHSQLQRMENHLKVRAIRSIDGKSYDITLIGLIIESDDIVDAVTESLVKTYLILFAVILPIGGLFSFFLLKPFRLTLQKIKDFSLKNPDKDQSFPRSSVPEFKKLNLFLEEMTQKVTHDYSALKEFSENASHELQTPIAIALSKLEVLLDNDNLTPDQMDQIGQIQSALKRMSNLSSSLGILTKIGNQEFDSVEEVNLSQTLQGILEEFSELISLKTLTLDVQIQRNVVIKTDKSLLELMLSNLINNSIRHNLKDGFIEVKLNPEELVICNSGENLDLDPNQLFDRFKKPNQSNQSIGLGLAIVKQVCERNGFEIGYVQADKKHRILVKF